MIIKMKEIVVLALLTMARFGCALRHEQQDCGATLDRGKLTVNCTGSYSVLYRAERTVHDCKESQIYHFPISVTVGRCTTLLVDHADCSDNGPCSSTGITIIEVVSFGVVLVSVVLLLFWCWISMFLKCKKCRVKAIEWRSKTIKVQRQEDCITISLVRLLVLCLLCREISPYCVEPHSSVATNESVVYHYRLRVGQAACFQTGQVLHKSNVDVYSLDHLYATSNWKPYVWSHNGCGKGSICGSIEDCGKFGSNGQIIQRSGGSYKKVCKTYSVPFLSCFYYWACWIATLEVSHKGPIYQVYSIGQSVDNDNYEQSGLHNAIVRHVSTRQMDLKGYALVKEAARDKAWLCTTYSEKGYPVSGKLGDTQIIHNEILHDYEGFRCELESQSSSGKCKVSDPFIGEISNHCEQLPLQMDTGVLDMIEGELVMTNSGYDDFDVEMGAREKPSVSNHDCHSKQVSLEGMKEDRGLYMYIFRAESVNQSTWLINTECTHEQIEILCNGKPVAYHLPHRDDIVCSFDGIQAVDNRKESGLIDWKWYGMDSTVGVASKPVNWVAIICLILVGLMILRCLTR
ncbi:putative glycoprotein [Narangue virus]|uniref:Putative glycoprotein n=1 Tax=Narangue virus TaxID=2689367 RepID=A0A6B9KGC1_9VIRU|nr:putative glycoprotein [Narangue virus]QHA33860.1 putative glycoprotein [Narangue virus]